MANTNTSNAVGTARQFTPQPQSTYQRQLLTPRLGNNIRARDVQSAGAQLAESLGVLQNAIEKYRQDYDTRQKDIAEKVVPILYGKEDHDTRLTIDSVALLNKAGIGGLQDNPYALALIDQLRGQEVSSEIHKRYDAYASQEKLKGTLEDEIKSYDDFYNEHVQEYLSNINVNNKYAMDNGLYESRVVNTGKVASKFVTDKEEEMSINRSEAISSFVSENTRNRWKWSEDEENNFVSQIGNLLTTTQERDPTKNYQILDNMMKTIASNTGNYGLLSKLKEAVVYGSQRLGDFIDIDKYKDLANESNKAHWMQRTRDIYDKVSTAKDKRSLYEIVDGFDDAEDRQIASGFVSGQLSSIEAEDRQRRAIELASAKAMTKAAVGNINLKAQLSAIMNGQTQDAMGNGIVMSSSQLKDLGIDENQMILAIDSAITNLNFDDPNAMSQLMRLSYHPAYKGAFSKVLQYDATAGLNSLTIDNQELTPSLQRCVDLYLRSPSLFNDMVTDSSLQAGVMCVATQGVPTYLQVKDVLGDKSRLEQIDKDMKDAVQDGVSGMSLPSLADGSSYEGFSYTEPNSVAFNDTYRNYARIYRAEGFSVDEAIRQTNYRLSSEYYAFNGCPIPKSVAKLCDIGGTDEDTCRSTFYWVLGSKLKKYCESVGVDSSVVTVSYRSNNSNGQSIISFSSSAGIVSYPLMGDNGIVTEARANLQQSGNQTYDAPASEEFMKTEDNTAVENAVKAKEDEQEYVYGNNFFVL